MRHARKLKENILSVGAVDWDRRLFDSLIPLPDGTSYNAYLVRGSEKTVLLDTVDPTMEHVLMENLRDEPKVDFIVAHHAEQDHSGTIPRVLEKYPSAKVLASPKCKGMLVDHLGVDEGRIEPVEDGQTVSLGNKTLKFIHTPWVHWPETMVTWLQEDRVLFTCDFFGSHLAASDLTAADDVRVYESAKRYYAEIMMPFRNVIRNNMEKIGRLDVGWIAPSHGPVYDRPAFILEAYRDWISESSKNQVVIPYVSMHGSTRKMVEHLVGRLTEKGITVFQIDLAVTDIGKLAIALVDAATLVVGTPTVHVGPHPLAAYAALLANALRPKLKTVSVIGSYGWASKAAEGLAGMIFNLKVDIIPPVMCKGYPREADFKALDGLAEAIAEKHKNL